MLCHLLVRDSQENGPFLSDGNINILWILFRVKVFTKMIHNGPVKINNSTILTNEYWHFNFSEKHKNLTQLIKRDCQGQRIQSAHINHLSKGDDEWIHQGKRTSLSAFSQKSSHSYPEPQILQDIKHNQQDSRTSLYLP